MAALLAGSQGAVAQTLMEVTGATAIQGTLNNINLVPASGTINRAKDASAAAQSSLNERSQSLPAPAAGPQGSFTPPARGSGGGGAPQPGLTTTSARVNGQLVPTCSHGALCHGALLRAMGGI